jgi:hypothetical protein
MSAFALRPVVTHAQAVLAQAVRTVARNEASIFRFPSKRRASILVAVISGERVMHNRSVNTDAQVRPRHGRSWFLCAGYLQR